MRHSETREEITAQVKEQADIVQVIGEHVDLKRSGVRYLGLCPFHGEKTPSFSVHAGQQFYYCFGCGESGDVFSFIMKYHHLDFPAALKNLAQRYHIELPERKKSRQEQERDKRRTLMFDVDMKAAHCFRHYLLQSPNARVARSYLEKRGIGDKYQEEYLLGYAPAADMEGWNFLGSQLTDRERSVAVEIGLLAERQTGGTYDRFRDRIMFPIFDARGRIAGFGGRIVGNENPKYLNSPESIIYHKSRLLFGLFHQRDAIRKQRRAVLVEGNFDLLSLVAHGFDAVVAPLGTALTREQVRQLKPLADDVVLLFDGDSAGVKAAERAVIFFLQEQVSGRVAQLPQHHDPDTYVREKGLAALNKMIDDAETLPEFVLDRLVDRHGLSLDGKGKIIEDLKPLLAAAASSLQRSVMAAHFARILGIDSETLLAQLAVKAQASGISRASAATGRALPVLRPLDGALRSLVSYAVLNPHQLPALMEAGITEFLSGTIGEVIFLQLNILHRSRGESLQPEELLTALPDGEERTLVMSLLLNAAPQDDDPQQGADEGDTSRSDELKEICDWLRRTALKKRSDQLMTDIREAQKTNDFSSINDLLQQKSVIDHELKDI